MRTALTAIAAAVAATALVVASTAPAAAGGPASVYSSSLAAARAQDAVHYVMSATVPGARIAIVGDAATDRGVQEISYRKGTRSGHVTVRVVANTAYIRGDAFTLQNYMGFAANTAATLDGKWLKLAHSASGFKTVAAAVRIGSLVDELKLQQPLQAVAPTTLQGQRVVGVRGRAVHGAQASTVTLYVRASGAPLPVKQDARSATSATSIVFSRWNARVTVAAPQGALPLG